MGPRRWIFGRCTVVWVPHPSRSSVQEHHMTGAICIAFSGRSLIFQKHEVMSKRVSHDHRALKAALVAVVEDLSAKCRYTGSRFGLCAEMLSRLGEVRPKALRRRAGRTGRRASLECIPRCCLR